MIITLTGENAFARQAELEKLVAEFVAEQGDMALERLDGEEADYQKIYDALTSLPFLASKKMVMLKSPSASREFAEKAEDLLENLPETTDLILVEPKFDKRSSLYKLLKNATDFREFTELDASGLSRWLVEQAKAQKGTISSADAKFLVERVGANQQLLKNELDKLILYNPKITRENIEQMSEPTPQSSIFDLLDAAFAGSTKKAMELYKQQRALKVEPQQIIAMIAWQLHVLALIKTAGERMPDQIAREAKLNTFVVRKSLGVAKSIDLSKLKELVKNLLTLDIRLKSESLDADEAMTYFLLNLGVR